MNTTSLENPGATFVADPYPAYRKIQTFNFPVWLPNNGSTAGTWVFTRYEDVTAILKEARISKDISRLVPETQLTPINYAMLSKDPPDHTRLRALVSMAFTPARIKDLEPRIEQIADELIAQIKTRRESDFMADFALPLPVIIIAELLGVPLEDRAMFRQWSDQVITGGESSDPGNTIDANQRSALFALSDYFSDLIRQRKQHPRPDLISDLIEVRDAHHRLNEPELIGTCILLLIAGHETSANLLGNGLLTLLRHSDQLALLRAHPELLPSAVEEMLRFESPLQQATYRVAAEPLTLGKTQIEAGHKITAIIGAANRDPAYFIEPERFDITRNPNRHLAFGMGIHFCLGASLARAEGRIGFSRVLDALPNIQLVDQDPHWNPNACLRGLHSLKIAI